MLDFHKNLRSLILTAFLGFASLSILIAIVPALQMQKVEPLPGQASMSPQEQRGMRLYVSEGCVACHTQQVRNIEMDEVWGTRPSLASDYYFSKKRMDLWRQSPSLLGSERTGPDLTEVGKRQPGKEWHLLHLYNPRTVVPSSIMPGYSWLFEEKRVEEISEEDVLVPVGTEFFYKKNKQVVAKQEALDLVSYLQSLKQASLNEGIKPEFIPSSKKEEITQTGNHGDEMDLLLNGKTLYMNTCAACHQADGKGITGAFPPLAGSKVVNEEDPELLIRIILQGYDARSEYGQMPAFGQQLDDPEIVAIVNHERSSWGNEATLVSQEEVEKIRAMIQSENL